jgi:RNA polymerase sigma-70 factor (ECF subfamily)
MRRGEEDRLPLGDTAQAKGYDTFPFRPGDRVEVNYDEAAEVCKVAVGTIKSRVNRARFQLTALMGLEDEAEIGSDSVMRATLAVE